MILVLKMQSVSKVPLPDSSNRLLASYGRLRGRRLRPSKQGLMDELLPQLIIDLPEQSADLSHWFPHAKEYWLEIGFGGGEHLAHQAKLYPYAGIIGCEPFINGTAALLAQIRDRKLENIRIHPHDARPLINTFPDASLSRVFVLYADPWPKARHHKRRLVSTQFLDNLGRVMKSGAQLRLATDDVNYCAWMLEHLLAHPDFTWEATRCKDWLNPPSDWISTRYEQKALAAGRVPTYLNFRRN